MKYCILMIVSCIASKSYADASRKEEKVEYLACCDKKQDAKVKKSERKRTRDIIKNGAKRYTSPFATSHFTTTALHKRAL